MLNFALYATTVLIWGSTWYAITFQLGEVPLEWSIIYRFFLSALLMFAFCLLTGRNLRFSWRQHRVFAGLGLFMFSTNYYFTYLGVGYITSGLVAVVFSTLTLMNIFNGNLFLKNKLEPQLIGAAFVGLTGIGLIFWPEIQSLDLTDATFIGVAITLVATWFASLGNTVASTKAARALPIVQMNAWGMLYGTGVLALYTVASGIPPAFDGSASYLISLVYLSVFGTVIAFSCFLLLLARMGLERAGYISVMFPLVALAISTVFENYHWTNQALIGVLLVLSGNVVMLRKKRPAGACAADPAS